MALLLLVDGMEKRNPKTLMRVGGNVKKRLKIKPKRKVERERQSETQQQQMEERREEKTWASRLSIFRHQTE